ncbi:MAG: hypothetical protein DME08_09255 [Candidatus Rokuibacteriota bacterium]|nr:MAG: hypothetical protein DME08_09255 [Candidatus Rokubacteria bacterium]
MAMVNERVTNRTTPQYTKNSTAASCASQRAVVPSPSSAAVMHHAARAVTPSATRGTSHWVLVESGRNRP